MTLPFGKWKGRDLSDDEVPLSYLVWAEEQDFITPQLRNDLNFEINRRTGQRPGAGKVVKKGA